MVRLKFAYPLLLVLASCAAPEQKFTDMTPAEIMVYNRTVEYKDQMYCSEQVSVGSHIRRQECLTYQDLVEGRSRSLNTPSSSYSAPPQL